MAAIEWEPIRGHVTFTPEVPSDAGVWFPSCEGISINIFKCVDVKIINTVKKNLKKKMMMSMFLNSRKAPLHYKCSRNIFVLFDSSLISQRYFFLKSKSLRSSRRFATKQNAM